MLLQKLQEQGVHLNEHAQTLLAHPVFDAPEERELHFVERTVQELGMADGGTLAQIFDAARQAGLTPCPATSGPYLRLATMGQVNAPDSVLSAGRPPAGALHVASEPLSDDDEYPKGFYLRVVDDRVWLRGYRCDAGYELGPDQRLAFVQPARLVGGRP